MDIISFIVGVVVGAVVMAGVIVYMQRRNITLPTPEQAEQIVARVIWAIEMAQKLYGSENRAKEAEQIAAAQLESDNLSVPEPLLRLIIRMVYHAIRPTLPPAPQEKVG